MFGWLPTLDDCRCSRNGFNCGYNKFNATEPVQQQSRSSLENPAGGAASTSPNVENGAQPDSSTQHMALPQIVVDVEQTQRHQGQGSSPLTNTLDVETAGCTTLPKQVRLKSECTPLVEHSYPSEEDIHSGLVQLPTNSMPRKSAAVIAPVTKVVRIVESPEEDAEEEECEEAAAAITPFTGAKLNDAAGDDLANRGTITIAEHAKLGTSVGCCGLFRRNKSEAPFRQVIVLLRHSERKDRVEPNYKDSEEGRLRPYDAPLTEHGLELATSVADELRELDKDAHFAAVATSPYARCVETAAVVAKQLGLGIVLDQEMGEIWDDDIPGERFPWRSPVDLQSFVDNLGVRLVNPSLCEGGVKLFGKPPTHPETLEDAKERFAVRIETYIEQSTCTRQNFIIVTHADALSAALKMFGRGNVNIEDIDYCARVIATRHNPKKNVRDCVYAERWGAEIHGVTADVMPSGGMTQYYEKVHLETVGETEKHLVKRRQRRTSTDNMFAAVMDDLRKGRGLNSTGSSSSMAEKRSTQKRDLPFHYQ